METTKRAHRVYDDTNFGSSPAGVYSVNKHLVNGEWTGEYELLVTGTRAPYQYTAVSWDKKALTELGETKLERLDYEALPGLSVNNLYEAADRLKALIESEHGDPEGRFKIDDVITDIANDLVKRLGEAGAPRWFETEAEFEM